MVSDTRDTSQVIPFGVSAAGGLGLVYVYVSAVILVFTIILCVLLADVTPPVRH